MSHCSLIAIVATAAVYVLYAGIFGKLSVDALSTDNFTGRHFSKPFLLGVIWCYSYCNWNFFIARECISPKFDYSMEYARIHRYIYAKLYGNSTVVCDQIINLYFQGPAKPRVKYMHICKGPKKRDCTNSTVTVHGDYNNITLRTRLLSPNVAIYKIKSSIWELKNNTVPGVADIVRNIDNPCNNFFFGPFFKAIAKLSDKCILDKSVYELNLNITNLFEDFLGDNFFYGHFKVKTVVMGKQCNLICCLSEFSLEPTTPAGPKKSKPPPLFH